MAKCSSRNEFVAKAIERYIGELALGGGNSFVTKALADSIQIACADSLGGISTAMFRYAVYADMMVRLVASYMEVDPGFESMMADMEDGKIGIIIVKDLSRLGRNYIETGRYIELTFPEYDVRFIAINDNYDSLHSENEQQLGIINIFNEWHAQTTSHKVRATFQSKAKRGERLATSAPYGYIKDPDNAGHIIPDPDTKDIVIRIFKEFLKDPNLKKIAKGLQNDQIITPGQYLYQKYGYVHSGVDITDPYRWSSTTIRSILRNQDYIGNTVNCKTKVKSFKVKKQIRLPKEEWLIFENTHEALVSKADLETVQLILDGRNRPDKSGKVDIFHNVIACAS